MKGQTSQSLGHFYWFLALLMLLHLLGLLFRYIDDEAPSAGAYLQYISDYFLAPELVGVSLVIVSLVISIDCASRGVSFALMLINITLFIAMGLLSTAVFMKFHVQSQMTGYPPLDILLVSLPIIYPCSAIIYLIVRFSSRA